MDKTAGIAWINSVGNLGGHFGPELIGHVRKATDSIEWAFYTLAVTALVGVCITLWVTRKRSAPVVAAAQARA